MKKPCVENRTKSSYCKYRIWIPEWAVVSLKEKYSEEFLKSALE